MTVSTTESVVEYISGGPAFPIPYRFLQDSDIQAVLVDQVGNAETLVLGTQYTLSGAGTQNGGTLTSAYAASVLATPGGSLTISRVMIPVQPTDLRNQGRFLAETHEFVFDRLTMLVQQGIALASRALLRPWGKNYYDAQGRQIKNLGTPTAPNDATNKGYVDAADNEINSRIDSLSAGLPGTNHAFPWSTTTTQSTKTLTPGFTFASATLYLNGIAQTYGKSFAVSGNKIVLAEAIPAGTEVYAILGQNVVPSPGYDDALKNYDELYLYQGSADGILITSPGIYGHYTRLGVLPGYTNDGGYHVVSANGVVWERDFTGNMQAIWFRYGANNDSTALSLAAKAATAYVNNSDGDYPLVPYCPWANVDLSASTWTLTEEVDTAGREIVWNVPVGCRIVGPEFINGRLLRDGNKVTDFHHGILDSSTGFSVLCNRKMDEMIPVGGIGTASRLSAGNGRDTVGAYFGNKIPAPTYSASAVASYSASGVTLATPMTDTQLRRMRRGMIIQTRHSTRYAGYVNSWTANSVSVLGGWFLVDGTPVGTPSTPAGTDGLDINVFRKAWAVNGNTFIDAGSYGNEIVGAEFGVSNAKGQSAGMGGNIATYGVLSASLQADANDYYNTYSYITGGRWVNGFVPIGGVRNAFIYRGDLGRADELQKLLTGINSSGAIFFDVDSLGNIAAGRQGGAVLSPWTMKLHSSGQPNDYDGYLSCTGGTSGNGAGIIEIGAGQVTLNAPAIDAKGVIRPDTDLGRSIGQLARRFLDTFSQRLRPGAGAVIWTSGTGSPEGVLTAPAGSLYTRTDGGSGTTLYVKESGAGNTGWVAK